MKKYAIPILIVLFTMAILVGCQEKPVVEPTKPLDITQEDANNIVEPETNSGETDTVIEPVEDQDLDKPYNDTESSSNEEIDTTPIVSDNIDNSFTIRKDIKVTLMSIEERKYIEAKNFVGELYNITPKYPNHKFVILELIYEGPAGFVELNFNPGLTEDKFRIKTKESTETYPMQCFSDVVDSLISCSFTGASKLALNNGASYKNKVVFTIPNNVTVDSLGYYYYAKEEATLPLN